MSLFKDAASGQSLFRNEDALDTEWVPKLLPFRDRQQFEIANCIKPLVAGRNGKNCLVFGPPGIGKTVATRWVLRDLEENTEGVHILYVNCWQKNTSFKIFVDLCEQLDYKFTQNKNSEDLFRVVQNMVNKSSGVFVFDEVDKVEDVNFLYSILSDIYKRSVVLITNYPNWLSSIEDRVRSRLLPDVLEFKPYSVKEMEGILRQRSEVAFVPGCWDDDAFQVAVSKAAQAGDVRVGLHVLREAGMAAEDDGASRISLVHAQSAVAKLRGFTTKEPDELDDDAKRIMSLVRGASGDSKMGDLFDSYQKGGGSGTYKTFQRRVERLSKGGFVETKKVIGGKDGTTTMVSEKNRSLSDF